MRIFLLSLMMLVFLQAQGQHHKSYFPLWTYHQSDIRIYGVGVGWLPIYETVNTTTNGLRLEVPGPGLFLAFIPRAPWDTAHGHADPAPPKHKQPEKVNGLNLSALGSMCYRVNGISLGTIAQINWRVNGISVSGGMNLAEKHNGIQVAAMSLSEEMHGLQIGISVASEYMRGVQFGFMTSSKNTRGLQFGLWNVNEKRKLPIVNWNFRP